MPKTFAPAVPALLQRLDQWLRLRRPVYFESLRPGVPERELTLFERDLGYNLPAGLRALYRWHDGQEPECAAAFQDDKRFMSLEDVRAARRALCQLLGSGEFPEKDWWSNAWFPFLDNGRGDHLCVDLAGTLAGTPGQLVLFYHDSECRNIEAPSLEKWLEPFVIGVEHGLWQEDGMAFEPVDRHQVHALSTRFAPGYPRERAAGNGLLVRGW
jgi:cell wall assembly regulator SMI1